MTWGLADLPTLVPGVTGMKPPVKIFDTGPEVIPALVEQQKEFSREWFASLRDRRKVEGYVLTLRCGDCAWDFPHAVFSGDTDMATNGLISLTSAERKELVFGEMTNEEFKLGEVEGANAACIRISTAPVRTDLRTIRIVGWEKERISRCPSGRSDVESRQQLPMLGSDRK